MRIVAMKIEKEVSEAAAARYSMSPKHDCFYLTKTKEDNNERS
jgi:hypothetical protein